MKKSKQLFTEITSDGQLNISLTERDVPTPKPHEVIVRIEAAPINPSDMWPMFGPANLAEASYDADNKVMSAPVHKGILPRMKSRLDSVELVSVLHFVWCYTY